MQKYSAVDKFCIR